MGSLLEPDGRFTPNGAELIRKVADLLRPVFKQFLEMGYTLDEIAEQVHQAVDFVKRHMCRMQRRRSFTRSFYS